MPYFDDMDDVGQRIARDPDGEAYYVPPDMTYKEWEKTFQEGGSKEGLYRRAGNPIPFDGLPESMLLKMVLSPKLRRRGSYERLGKQCCKL